MASSHFTLENLPYGVISIDRQGSERYLATAYKEYAVVYKDFISDHNADFQALSNWSVIEPALQKQTWNDFAGLEANIRQEFRTAVTRVLEQLINQRQDNFEECSGFALRSDVVMHLPMEVRGFADFYCSHEHAKNCSEIFGTEVPDSWYFLPQVYNGRSSAIAVSGTPITRPCGIFPSSVEDVPELQPENRLDFELEVGVWVSKSIPRGERLNIANAKSHIFGLTLLNDWSARSIQFFEMAPLGPFHSKGSLTSVSPWIIPIESLEAHASCAPFAPQAQVPLPHLFWDNKARHATWDVTLKCKLIRDGKEYLTTHSNLNELHWTPLQQITHLASAGEGIGPGDLFGTGTISSARQNGRGEKIGLGCLWERRLPAAKLQSLPDDIAQTCLLDGDEVVMTGEVIDDETGKLLFGFGECRGKVLSARPLDAWEKQRHGYD